MAWALAHVFELGAVDRARGTVIESADPIALKAFCCVVKEGRLDKDRRSVLIESPHIADRLVALGMAEGAFRVRRIRHVPEEYTPYLVRGILDVHGSVATFGSYFADIVLEFPSRQPACMRFMLRELRRRGYHVRVEPRDVDFIGISRGEPAGYVHALKMSRADEIVDCYGWLYNRPFGGIPVNRAQRSIWSQLNWMLRDLEACSDLLADKKLLSDLHAIVKRGKVVNLMGDWKE